VTLENIGSGRCTGTATLEAMLTVGRHRRRVVLGHARFKIDAKRKRVVKIALDAAGRQQLRMHQTVAVRLVVTVDGGRTQQRMIKIHPDDFSRGDHDGAGR
jgi:hypothetical protein